ncbi:fasciclin domain-containing protein [Fortiea contorta]|uniref:fasciclin domain-containing protein n=1 Tax=Fortiea contorta TaxID=1892405 RepID=UPI00037BCEC5|nr:fasciclin domain-containing protein [Fortiea contorta]
MKTSKGIVRKALFNIVGGCSLLALSACAEPVTQTPTTTTASPLAETPTTTVPPVTQTPTTPIPTITATPTASPNQNLVQQLQSSANQGQFQTLAKAVQAAGLTDRLSAPGPYTVFAPTDAAFAALPKTTLDNLLKPANKQKLVQLLSYHVIPGRITATELKSGQVKTLEGSPVTIKVDRASNTITVNGATVAQADIPASNGVIHIVDQVIVPTGFKVSLKTNPTRQ